MIATRKIPYAEGLTKYIGFTKIFECPFSSDHHGIWGLQGIVWVTMLEFETKHGNEGTIPNLDVFPKYFITFHHIRLNAIPTVIIGHQVRVSFFQPFAQRPGRGDVHADVWVFPNAGQEILPLSMTQLLVYL